MHQPLPLESFPSPSTVPSVAAPHGVSFTGERRAFRKLLTRGTGLELLTFGFYRFWLATDMRRHLWSHTSIGGDTPEYTGTAKELLIGFLVALAILMPVYLVYFFIGLEAERIQAFASVPLLAFFFLFTQFALYRARRYRLTRTVWRGVRFSMGGSGWSYAWRSALWSVWVWTTLGLALPWRTAALERFKMRHTSYGNLQASFEGTGKQFFKQAWWLWLITVLTWWLIIPLPMIYAVYKALEWKWWLSNIRFGDVRVESDLDGGDLMGLYWKVIGWAVLLFTAMSVWFGAVIGLGAALINTGGAEQHMALVTQHPLVLIGMGAGYLLTALGLNIVVRIYLTRDLWAKIADTTVVHNLAAADNVAGHGDAVNALGEGFADSLDVGGF